MTQSAREWELKLRSTYSSPTFQAAVERSEGAYSGLNSHEQAHQRVRLCAAAAGDEESPESSTELNLQVRDSSSGPPPSPLHHHPAVRHLPQTCYACIQCAAGEDI